GSPQLILLCCGKRKSGKDYLTDYLESTLPKDHTVILRLSGPLKECYARDHGLDFDQLLSATDYKEKYRLDMIQWSERIRRQDHGYFCRAAIDKYQATGFPLWIVSDCRRATDFQFFQDKYPGKCRTIRIQASDTIRESRGFVFKAGVDDKESECGLDDQPSFDHVHMASSHPPVDHDYSVRQLDATVVESLQKSGAAICSSESPMSKMFAKCDKCRRSRIKVLVPNSLLSVAKGKNDGQTCDFCGTIMPPDSPQFLPNVFEGRRGCKIGDKRSDSNPLGRKRNRLYVHCGECGKVILKESLSKHFKDVHDKSNQKKCPHCSKVLSGAFSLREHVNAVHLRNFEHICSHCEKSFAHFSNLNRHIRLVHKQLLVTHKYVNCSECKKVVQSSSLKKHIRSIHDKQRDFQCQYCDKNFAQSYSLKEHVGAKHTHDWSHICLLCQKTFAHRNNCGRHIRSVHKQEIKSKNFHDYMMSSQISNL
ncbi:hypothetical protein TCAL_06796, partial [Tigriopus californicus]